MNSKGMRLLPSSCHRFWSVLLVAIILLGWCPAILAQDSFAFPIEGERARVSFVQGKVQRQTPPEVSWSALALGVFVQAGERIKTMKGGRLELQLPDGSIMRFDEESEVQLVSASYNQEQSKRDVHLSLTLGKTWANIREAFGNSRGVQVETDNAIVGVRGTVFRMNVAVDRSAMVRVYRGKVAVSKPHRVPAPGESGSEIQRVPGPTRVAGPHRVTIEEWIRIVESMQQVTVSSEGVPSKPRPFTMEEDLNDWVQWNLQRDRQI
jgi:ferric-dicitrate binding protein FerR (iron transport regulator)